MWNPFFAGFSSPRKTHLSSPPIFPLSVWKSYLFSSDTGYRIWAFPSAETSTFTSSEDRLISSRPSSAPGIVTSRTSGSGGFMAARMSCSTPRR